MITNFKQFIESNEPLRIKLSPWKQHGEKDSTDPNTFIELFNKEVNAQDTFTGEKAYLQGSAIIQYSMKQQDGAVYVTDLQTQPRGFPAISFLTKLTKLADQHKVTLSCISEPLNVEKPVDKERLTNLYKLFGFVPEDEESDYLVRKPRNKSHSS